ncbi:MAG: M67 family metallopeptidase [Proteobacteria bacterium]|nr:M67 family metallopeptidase [Pseudomonadota bacterium]
MINISKDIYDEMVVHVKGGYPNECCGALLGKVAKDEAGTKSVDQAHALTNINEERSADRYEIDPLELLKVEKEASKNGLVVVGFYHSHPDHPDEPSGFDRERAWPDYSYVIIAVEGGVNIKTRSWTFTEMEAPFEAEEMNII